MTILYLFIVIIILILFLISQTSTVYSYYKKIFKKIDKKIKENEDDLYLNLLDIQYSDSNRPTIVFKNMFDKGVLIDY